MVLESEKRRFLFFKKFCKVFRELGLLLLCISSMGENGGRKKKIVCFFD